jgi:hypothetical protein
MKAQSIIVIVLLVAATNQHESQKIRAAANYLSVSQFHRKKQRQRISRSADRKASKHPHEIVMQQAKQISDHDLNIFASLLP